MLVSKMKNPIEANKINIGALVTRNTKWSNSMFTIYGTKRLELSIQPKSIKLAKIKKSLT